MIVLDASVVVDLLLDVPPHCTGIFERIRREPGGAAAPHLLDAEVGQVVRRLTLARRIDALRARAVLRDLGEFSVVRYPHGPLLDRAFALRDQVTMYDALYIVLAEALGARLLSRDRALGRVRGHQARVEILP
ncbi:MAG: type II toxin-antitoxin system VapC family toxin [Planctomycetes bacterium]|nr:type II toxin-antitoxin system VapC family toxin [Planctomycetota bacterium]